MTATESLPLICRCGHPRRLHDDIGCEGRNCDCTEFRDGVRPAHVPPARPTITAPAPAPTVIHRPAPQPAAQVNGGQPQARAADDPRVLIAAAKRSDNRRIFAIGYRVEADLAKLLELIREERAKAEEKEAAAQQTAEARAEVARLEAQLAAAKAKLRPGVQQSDEPRRYRRDKSCDVCGRTGLANVGRHKAMAAKVPGDPHAAKAG